MVDSLTPRHVWFLVNLGSPGRFQYSAYIQSIMVILLSPAEYYAFEKITVLWKTSRGCTVILFFVVVVVFYGDFILHPTLSQLGF